jgi:hypothetical protein
MMAVQVGGLIDRHRAYPRQIGRGGDGTSAPLELP